MRNEDAARQQLLYRLCVGEALTGLGLTLLGCLLPNLSSVWHLTDAQAGALFMAQFAGASGGALLVTADYRQSLNRGLCLMSGGALSIAFISRANQAFVLFFVFGLGLGLTMTSISVLAGKTFPDRRGSVLSILNAAWGLGAVVSPTFAVFWAQRWNSPHAFLPLAAGSLLVLLVVCRCPRIFVLPEQGVAIEDASLPLRPILVFALLCFLYVGVESCVSGWMMSYVQRLVASYSTTPPIATSCFWIALLGGRAVSPTVLRHVSESRLLGFSMLCAFASLLLLLANQTALVTMLGAAGTGFGLGPIYPLCLSRVLAFAKDSPRTKWVFAIAGLGAAVFPWLTGELATVNGSLRVGLVVPLFALATMMTFWFTGGVSPGDCSKATLELG